MKVLGFLFVLLLALAVFGYVQGWFAVDSHASGRTVPSITIDDDKIAADAAAAKRALGLGAAETNAAPSASDVDGTITLVEPAGRDLTVIVGGETIVQHVAADVAITRGGMAVAFAQLRVNMRVRFAFAKGTSPRQLLRIEVLP